MRRLTILAVVLAVLGGIAGCGSGGGEPKSVKLAGKVAAVMSEQVTRWHHIIHTRSCDKLNEGCEESSTTYTFTPDLREEPSGCVEDKEGTGYNWVCRFIKEYAGFTEHNNYLVELQPDGCFTARGEFGEEEAFAASCAANEDEQEKLMIREETRSREEEQKRKEEREREGEGG